MRYIILYPPATPKGKPSQSRRAVRLSLGLAKERGRSSFRFTVFPYYEGADLVLLK